MIDTKGPEIRTTKTDNPFPVKIGDTIRIKGDPNKQTVPGIIYLSYENFVDEMRVGEKILIDDGALELSVIEKKGDELICRVENNGEIKSRKSINVPGVSFNLPSLTEKDKAFIDLAIEHDIEFIAHSFVRNTKDVQDIQNLISAANSRVKIIAKIENQEGVDNIDQILEHVYGVMVARGDLGIEIPYEKIPGIQKMLVKKCIERRKPVIIATQMLHSMIENPRPTRAEVSDIASAIFSKADAIMLSGETTIGAYPIEAVKTMTRVAEEVEASRKEIHETPVQVLTTEISAFLTKSAVEAAVRLNAKCIIADTMSGKTIRNMAGFRGRKIIYALCYDTRTVRELALSFGVYAEYLKPSYQHEFVHQGLKALMAEGIIESEDMVVTLGGSFGKAQGASFLEISNAFNLFNAYKNGEN
jgi:pyruvate kinase